MIHHFGKSKYIEFNGKAEGISDGMKYTVRVTQSANSTLARYFAILARSPLVKSTFLMLTYLVLCDLLILFFCFAHSLSFPPLHDIMNSVEKRNVL